MTVEIRTEYCGQGRYRIHILTDGRMFQSHGATLGTVVLLRNWICEDWASQAYDMRTKGQAQ